MYVYLGASQGGVYVRVYQTKIIPPRLRGTVSRDRLFQILDSLSDYPVTWVASPAGTGKTTLVASYIQARRIPTVWYRVDEADGDVAGFFYYMAEAAKTLKKGRSRPLPLFTPEYRLGMAAFTRHYFDSLFQKMSIPGAIVFDNYQDAPENSEFHEVLRSGLRLIPEGVRIFVASRSTFPAPFVSLEAESILTCLGWEDIRFTKDEVREMVHQRKVGEVSEDVVERIHEETQGWAAAVILMLDQKEVPSLFTKSIGHSSIFSYFSVEVFHKLDMRIKDFLTSTALLPSVSPDIAFQLTGVSESSTILEHLNKHQYFTDRYGDNYHYHPLFREFLLDQARKTYDAKELVLITIRAGQILAQSGQTEEAIRLLLDVSAHLEALPLILGYAPTLLTQGRTATLEEWAGKLPQEMREATPWLSYWLGMGRLVTNPTEARHFLEKAFQLFEAQRNSIGSLLAAAGIINSIAFPWDDYRLLDTWIEWIDRNVDAQKPLADPVMEAQISSAMVLGLAWRMPAHQNIGVWIERALSASRQVEDLSVRLTAKGHVMEYYGFMGHWAEMRLVAEEFRQIGVSSQTSPLVHLAHMIRIIETHDWIHGSWQDTYGRLQKTLQLAQDVGAYLHFGTIFMHGVWIGFEMENLQLAGEFLRRMEEQSAFMERKMARAFYHSMSALYFLQKGDLTLAHQNADNAVRLSIEAGVPMLEVWSRLAFAYALRRQGKKEEAGDQLVIAEKIVAPAGITHALYLLRLTQASLLFDKGDVVRGSKVLGEAFRIGREKGYGMTLYWFWQQDEMARLCTEALHAGVEVDYAMELITKCRLKPGAPPERLMEWPITYRVRTLGHFEILVHEKPLTFTGKVQKKPLALLKSLIAFGGRDVREESIEDELWPDADGDVARIALKTTLSRLRNLLGNERVIEVREGKMTLNNQQVWLDTWAIESLAKRVSRLWEERRQGKSQGETEELAELVVELYQGEFIPGEDEPWADSFRERLRNSFLRTVEKLVYMLNEFGEKKKAISLYEKAIERGISPKEIHFQNQAP